MDDEIANKTIELRINVNIKFADAIIAATAIVNNLTLITRNINDFKKIDKIDVMSPFEDTI